MKRERPIKWVAFFAFGLCRVNEAKSHLCAEQRNNKSHPLNEALMLMRTILKHEQKKVKKKLYFSFIV